MKSLRGSFKSEEKRPETIKSQETMITKTATMRRRTNTTIRGRRATKSPIRRLEDMQKNTLKKVAERSMKGSRGTTMAMRRLVVATLQAKTKVSRIYVFFKIKFSI